MEMKARTQEPVLEPHLGENDQAFFTKKTLVEDAINSSFCLNSTYVQPKGTGGFGINVGVSELLR